MALQLASNATRRLLQSSSSQQRHFLAALSARYLSTAIAEKPVKKRRRTLQTKDPIVLVSLARCIRFVSIASFSLNVLLIYANSSQTERAADRIKEILGNNNSNTDESALGIRLGTKRRGCNGLSYTLNYAYEKPDKDIEMESHGVKIFIEPMALFNVVGTTMDWEETEMSSEFTFNNPNSKGECGCGESFTV